MKTRSGTYFRCAALGLIALAAQTLPALPADDAVVPDFSGIWNHGTLPWLIPPASGPGPVTNKSRRQDDGASDYNELVGDYSNPILQPWAADVVKKLGDRSRAGEVFPSPANQCWPEPPPFLLKHMNIQILQQRDKVTMLFNEDHEVRHVRMNAQHPARLTPTWHGDAVGHYEGDALVIDTVGIKADRKFAMIDLFGTPYTGKLHVVERWRLVDLDGAKGDLERQAKENWRPGGPVDPNYKGKYLKVELRIEDEGAFTTPWTASMVYLKSNAEWPEVACAENPTGFYKDKDAGVPTATKADF